MPELAEGSPTISPDRKTYVFTIRSGFRFSDGSAIGPANFAAAIDRVLNPRMHADYQRQFMVDIVGSDAVIAGTATHAAGVRARGNRLIIRLSKAAGDLVERFAWLPQFCPVPVNLPPEPVDDLPQSGPYFVASRNPGQSIVLQRNPFYRGKRPRREPQIEITVGGTQQANFEATERGEVDYSFEGPPFEAISDVVRRYGIGRRRFFLRPLPITFFLALNSDRPLFRNNPALRRAVNFALDRRAILNQGGATAGRATGQILPLVIPGAQTVRLYRHNVALARRLARGHLRGGRAVLYEDARVIGLKRAEIVKQSLARIGLDVEVKTFARPVLSVRVPTRGEPFDLALMLWIADYLDPGGILVPQLDGRRIRPADNTNVSYFDDAEVNRELEAADRLVGPSRYRTFGDLDVEIMKGKAPLAPLYNPSRPVFVSKRLGCVAGVADIVDYGALCLRVS